MNKNSLSVFAKSAVAVMKKELRSFFDSPTAYVALISFLVLLEFLFFKQAFLSGEASLRSLFSLLPWLFLLLIPSLTMGSISQEKSEGTLEFLLTKPIKELHLVVGKFLAAAVFVSLIFLLLAPAAFGFSYYGNLDWGAFVAQCFAGLFTASFLIALGIAISSLFSNQISSFLATAITGLFLVILGFNAVTAGLPFWLALVAERLSLLTHSEAISRGVIDMRDAWYFASFTIVFLGFAWLMMIKRKYGSRSGGPKKAEMILWLFVMIVVFTNAIGLNLPGRLDLTEGKIFTLTKTTEESLGDLKEKVNIKLYASKELPAQVQPVLREVKDILNDYQKMGGGNVVLEIKDPFSNAEAAKEAQEYGIQETQFNVIGNEEFQMKKGVFGLAVLVGDKHESIPYIQSTDNLEYQLTSFIVKLTDHEKKKILFASGAGSKNLYSDYSLLEKELAKQFEVGSLDMATDSPEITEDTALIVFGGADNAIGESALEKVKDYMANGGATMFLIDGVAVNENFNSVASNTSNILPWLEENLGVSVANDLVYDLRSKETVSFSGGGMTYYLPYPFWTRAIPRDQSPLTAMFDSIIMPWPSSLVWNDVAVGEKGYKITELFGSSDSAGAQKENFNISPEQNFASDDLKRREFILALQPKDDTVKNGLVIIASDSDFVADKYFRNSSENAAFFMESVSWLAQEKSLAGIQIKQQRDRRLSLTGGQAKKIKYANLAFVVALPLLIGFIRFELRREKKKRVYGEN